MNLSPDQRFDALKLRFQDQVELLRFMAKFDIEIFGGYLTLQLALGAFLAKNAALFHLIPKIGIGVIDLALTWIAIVFLRNNFYRRKEVVLTLTNVMSALEYDANGVYAEGPINPIYKFRPWGPWFVVVVSFVFVGVMLVLFGGP